MLSGTLVVLFIIICYVSVKSVVVRLGCQIDWIWNQLKDKLLGILVMTFLHRLFKVENLH